MKTYTENEKGAIITEWKTSGVSVARWCKQKGFPATTLYGWIRKKSGGPQLNRKDFLSFKENLNPCAVEIEYFGITIRLSKGWDQNVLEKCLSALKAASC